MFPLTDLNLCISAFSAVDDLEVIAFTVAPIGSVKHLIFAASKFGDL